MTSSQHTETALQREQRTLRELSSRLLDIIISKLFDLSPASAARRSSLLSMLFVGAGFLISIYYHPLSLWIGHIRNILYSVLSPSNAPLPMDAAFTEFFNFVLAVLLDPRILQYLPVFLAPFFIAQQTAAIYLADIFELEDVAVARQFINSVALSGSSDTIRIKEGKVVEDDMDKPMFLIGGPGKVLVELDSVALFERADGTPHVIGPTGKEPGARATIDGFERFREALDIRNHYVELRDQNENALSVFSRSRDGIPIQATDVRLMFSLYRGEKPVTTPEHPYPINTKAIENIVYKASSSVMPELPNPSYYDFNWVNNMINLIRNNLGGFMSEHNLTEYLASTGTPEFDKAVEREGKISEQVKRLGEIVEDDENQKGPKPPPSNFQPRYKVKNLFAQFTDDFTEQARNNGVELKWIGVGTWATPIDSVLTNHLDAWKLTQDNLKNDSPAAMNRIEQDEVNKKMKELIQKVPLAAYEEITSGKSYKKSSKHQPKKAEPDYYYEPFDDDVDEEDEDDNDQLNEILETLHDMKEEKEKEEKETPVRDINHEHDVKALLLEYKKLLQETIDFLHNKKDAQIPKNVTEAIKNIENQSAHWAGRS